MDKAAQPDTAPAGTEYGLPRPVVFVVDDEEVIRDSLALLLELAGYAAETYASSEDFLAALDGREPEGCVLADMCMPGLSGLQLIETLRRRALHLPVIVITAHGDVPMTVSALKLGAADFVEKPFDHDSLMASIAEALDRASRDRDRRTETARLAARRDQLTPRERQVMTMVADGYSNKIIGRQLDISPRTVEIHRARMMEKMGARSVSDLLRMVVRLSADEE